MDTEPELDIQSSKRKCRMRRTASALCRILTVSALIILAIFAVLPAAVSWQVNRILNGIIERRGFAYFRLIHTGLFSTHASFICGDNKSGGEEDAIAPICSIYYRPFALLAGKIDCIETRGVTLRGIIRDGKLEFPALRVFSTNTTTSENSVPFSIASLSKFPLGVNYLRISGNVIISGDDEHGRTANAAVPFSALINAPNLRTEEFTAEISVNAPGLALILNAKCKASEQIVDANWGVFMDSKIISHSLSTIIPEDIAIDSSGVASAVFDGPKLKNLNADASAEITIGDITLSPVLNVTGDASEIRADLHGIRINTCGHYISVKTSDLLFHPGDGSIFGKIILNLPNLRPLEAEISGSVPGSISLNMDIPEIQVTDTPVVVSNTLVNVEINTNASMNAEFSIGQVALDGTAIADLCGNFNLSQSEGTAMASINALGLRGILRTDIGSDTAGCTCVSNVFEMSGNVLEIASITNLVPMVTGFELGGDIKAKAEYIISKSMTGGSAEFFVNNGYVTNSEKNISVSGINFNFNLPNISEMKSKAQIAHFDSLRIGNFATGRGLAFFRMLEPTEWQLNNLMVDWCGGNVSTESILISPDKKGYSIIMHCDRLNLSSLLRQIGMGEDMGNGGFVSGSIPVGISASGDRIIVRKGYLYSTPGETGHIMLKPSDSIGAAATASAETALAVDSLADFSYSWIRVGIDSDGETDDLLVRFEMEGKPSKKLSYSIGGGGIVRSAIPNEFKKITLDTTFRLPVSDTLKLMGSLKKEGI